MPKYTGQAQGLDTQGQLLGQVVYTLAVTMLISMADTL